MKSFTVLSSETVYYETQIEAENEEEAKQKFWDTIKDPSTLETYSADNWQIDEIREEQV